MAQVSCFQPMPWRSLKHASEITIKNKTRKYRNYMVSIPFSKGWIILETRIAGVITLAFYSRAIMEFLGHISNPPVYNVQASNWTSTALISRADKEGNLRNQNEAHASKESIKTQLKNTRKRHQGSIRSGSATRCPQLIGRTVKLRWRYNLWWRSKCFWQAQVEAPSCELKRNSTKL